MPAEILDLYTINTAGRRKRTFGPNESIAWQMDVRFTDVTPGTSINYSFIAKRVGDAYAAVSDWDERGRNDVVWTPSASWDFDLDISPGVWWMSIAWTLPGSDPTPTNIRWDRLRGILNDRFAEASWSGTWELQGRVSFLEADRVDEWDFTTERFAYRIEY